VSKVTPHLDTAVGDVKVFPDEPQPLIATKQASSAEFAAEMTMWCRGCVWRIFGTAVVAGREDE